MTDLTNIGDAVVGKRLIFLGQRVGKQQLVSGKKKHRKQRVKLDNGRCWIESPIDRSTKVDINSLKK